MAVEVASWRRHEHEILRNVLLLRKGIDDLRGELSLDRDQIHVDVRIDLVEKRDVGGETRGDFGRVFVNMKEFNTIRLFVLGNVEHDLGQPAEGGCP